MNILATITLAVLAAELAGCETAKPLPDGYTGPSAILKDSSTAVIGGQCGDFFFLNAYEGKSIENVYVVSMTSNQGSGPIFRTVREVARAVPVRPLHLEIIGRTHCAAPIAEILGITHIVYGPVEFTPQENGVYVITGELESDHSAVWIKDDRTGAQMSDKLVINGSAKQGLLGATGKVEVVHPPQ